MTDASVLVDSRGGNTRKVADAIAEELGIKARDVMSSTDDTETSCSSEVEPMVVHRVML